MIPTKKEIKLVHAWLENKISLAKLAEELGYKHDNSGHRVISSVYKYEHDQAVNNLSS